MSNSLQIVLPVRRKSISPKRFASFYFKTKTSTDKPASRQVCRDVCKEGDFHCSYPLADKILMSCPFCHGVTVQASPKLKAAQWGREYQNLGWNLGSILSTLFYLTALFICKTEVMDFIGRVYTKRGGSQEAVGTYSSDNKYLTSWATSIILVGEPHLAKP